MSGGSGRRHRPCSLSKVEPSCQAPLTLVKFCTEYGLLTSLCQNELALYPCHCGQKVLKCPYDFMVWVYLFVTAQTQNRATVWMRTCQREQADFSRCGSSHALNSNYNSLDSGLYIMTCSSKTRL